MENSTEDVEVRSIDVELDLEHALQEHYVLKQSLNLWQGPKYPGYCSIIEHIRSFENWGLGLKLNLRLSLKLKLDFLSHTLMKAQWSLSTPKIISLVTSVKSCITRKLISIELMTSLTCESGPRRDTFCTSTVQSTKLRARDDGMM
jgi:hypothetical protein